MDTYKRLNIPDQKNYYEDLCCLKLPECPDELQNSSFGLKVFLELGDKKDIKSGVGRFSIAIQKCKIQFNLEGGKLPRESRIHGSEMQETVELIVKKASETSLDPSKIAVKTVSASELKRQKNRVSIKGSEKDPYIVFDSSPWESFKDSPPFNRSIGEVQVESSPFILKATVPIPLLSDLFIERKGFLNKTVMKFPGLFEIIFYNKFKEIITAQCSEVLSKVEVRYEYK